jgi:hypothetical protein
MINVHDLSLSLNVTLRSSYKNRKQNTRVKKEFIENFLLEWIFQAGT